MIISSWAPRTDIICRAKFVVGGKAKSMFTPVIVIHCVTSVITDIVKENQIILIAAHIYMMQIVIGAIV